MKMTGLNEVYRISCFDCNDDDAHIHFGTRQMYMALPTLTGACAFILSAAII